MKISCKWLVAGFVVAALAGVCPAALAPAHAHPPRVLRLGQADV